MASGVGLLELTSKHWATHPIWICVIAPADCSATPGPLGLDTPGELGAGLEDLHRHRLLLCGLDLADALAVRQAARDLEFG